MEKPVIKEITDGNPANFFEFFDYNGKLLVILQNKRSASKVKWFLRMH